MEEEKVGSEGGVEEAEEAEGKEGGRGVEVVEGVWGAVEVVESKRDRFGERKESMALF